MSEFWDTKKVSDFLGVDPKTVTQNYIAKKGLIVHQMGGLGGRYRFKQDEVEKWFEKQKING